MFHTQRNWKQISPEACGVLPVKRRCSDVLEQCVTLKPGALKLHHKVKVQKVCEGDTENNLIITLYDMVYYSSTNVLWGAGVHMT